jgi:hypothetical protein
MIYKATPDFDFSKLHLGSPVPLQGGSFFTKINATDRDDTLYVYTPTCICKSGVVSSGSKKYMDLVFKQENINMIQWLTSLEERLHELILEKKDTWFVADSITLDDIQNAFVPCTKVGKGNHVVRTHFQQSKQDIHGTIKVYDEAEMPKTIEDIHEQSNVLCILEFQGIKFSQKQFQVILYVKQVMLLNKAELFQQPLIRPKVHEPMVDVHPMKIDDELEKAKNTLKEAMEKVKKLQKTYGDSTELFE